MGAVTLWGACGLRFHCMCYSSHRNTPEESTIEYRVTTARDHCVCLWMRCTRLTPLNIYTYIHLCIIDNYHWLESKWKCYYIKFFCRVKFYWQINIHSCMQVCVRLFSIYSYVGLSVHHCLNYAGAVILYFSRVFFLQCWNIMHVSFVGKWCILDEAVWGK